MNRIKLFITASFMVMALSGCQLLTLPFILGATTVGVATKIVIDKRSAGAQIEDNSIDNSLSRLLVKSIPNTHIQATTFNRVVLLTGEVPNAGERRNAESLAKAHDNVRGVFNYLTVGPNSGFGARSSDSLITSKVKTSLIGNDSVKARDIKVVTETGVVYMFGIVSTSEAQIARDVTSGVGGVQKVVTLFEIAQ